MKEMMPVASDQSETRTELVAAEAHFTKETVIQGQCGTLIYLLRKGIKFLLKRTTIDDQWERLRQLKRLEVST